MGPNTKLVQDTTKRHVEKIPFGDRDGCFIVLSFGQKRCNYGDCWLDPLVSYLFMGEEVAAEWEPAYGPIQMWFKGDEINHYTFPKIKDRPGSWSQLAVDREGLKGFALRGQHDAIFNVLKEWADRDNE